MGDSVPRWEMARALVNHPAMLVIDEATSALHAEREQRIGGESAAVVAHLDYSGLGASARRWVVRQGTHQVREGIR